MDQNRVIIHDVTVREGSQNKSELGTKNYKFKIDLFEKILAVGYQSAELTAFAPGEWFSDAEQLAEGVRSLATSNCNNQFGNNRISAIYFNIRGLEKLITYPHLIQQGIFHTAVTDNYRVKNYNQRSSEEAILKLEKHLISFKEKGLCFDNLVLSTFFGEEKTKIKFSQVLNFLVPLLNISAQYGLDPKIITIADTEGVVEPYQLEVFFNQLNKEIPKLRLKLHLHPVKKRAVELCKVALAIGIREFDTSILGIGGSPYSNNHRGNLDIRDLLRATDRAGLSTGIRTDRLEEIEKFLGGEVFQTI